MKTDVITVTDDLQGMDAAIEAEEKFTAYHGRKFWLESERTKKGMLCLSAEKQVNKEQEAPMPPEKAFVILNDMAERGKIDQQILESFRESEAWKRETT